MNTRGGWTSITFLYAIFGCLVLLDLGLAVLIPDFKNELGEARGPADAALRFLPDCVLLLFYGVFIYRTIMLKQELVKWVIAHSTLFLVIAVLLALPWIGLLTAPFSPVSILYFAALYLPVYSYPAIIVLSILFAVANIWCLVRAVRRREVDLTKGRSHTLRVT
jgi:hypothetical protein